MLLKSCRKEIKHIIILSTTWTIKKLNNHMKSDKKDHDPLRILDDIENVDFDTTSEIKFDYLGSPYNGGDTPLNSGVISLRAGQMTATINIEPVTGFISIAD